MWITILIKVAATLLTAFFLWLVQRIIKVWEERENIKINRETEDWIERIVDMSIKIVNEKEKRKEKKRRKDNPSFNEQVIRHAEILLRAYRMELPRDILELHVLSRMSE